MNIITCDAILFDLDGVLIDSTSCIQRHWQEWAARHQLDIRQIMNVAHGRRTIETMRLVAPHLDAETQSRQFAAMEAVDSEGVITIPGAPELLKSLSPDAWAIATSGSRDVAAARLTHAGLPIPQVLVTGDDVARGKPDPEPYLTAASRLGIAPERCVVIEDSPAGIQAAFGSGMRILAVASTHGPHELGQAEHIVAKLLDIHIQNGNRHQIVIRI